MSGNKCDRRGFFGKTFAGLSTILFFPFINNKVEKLGFYDGFVLPKRCESILKSNKMIVGNPVTVKIPITQKEYARQFYTTMYDRGFITEKTYLDAVEIFNKDTILQSC